MPCGLSNRNVIASEALRSRFKLFDYERTWFHVSIRLHLLCYHSYTQLSENTVETFTIRDLRERTGELVRGAEAGELSVVTKHGQPVFLAVPMDEQLIRSGVALDLAIKLYRDDVLSLGKAARMAGLNVESFMDVLGEMGIAIIDYDPSDLSDEVAALS